LAKEQKIRSHIINTYFWLAPFICFIAGYSAMHQLFHIPEFATPSVVGKNIHEAFAILSTHNLNARLLEEKEDPYLPSGTVISQTPQAGQQIKPHQSLFVLLSKKPSRINAPHCLHKTDSDIASLLQTNKIRAKVYTLPSIYPKGLCFAQIPLPQEPIEDIMLTLYVSGGNKKPVIWPDFTQLQVSDVTNFLRTHALEATIVHEHPCLPNHTCASCTVTDQRPLAGSLVTLDPQKPCAVQLQVRQTF
jgi:beta-lactam-binding protein with PASTA domain